MRAFAELIRSLVRPFIVIWGFTLYGVCIFMKLEVPPLLGGLISAMIIEYFGERAIKRLKEK